MLKRNILLLLFVGYWGIVYAQQMNTLWGDRSQRLMIPVMMQRH